MVKKRSSTNYQHSEKALLRPEAGAQQEFTRNHQPKPPQKYRYDSSLAPELYWDEGKISSETDQLLQDIRNADNLQQAKNAAEKLQKMQRPFLNWAGKSERDAFEVPTLPLFIHERLSTEAILHTLERHKRNRAGTLNLFGEGDKSIMEKMSGAYQHTNGWQNRLILGDSLQVANSLLEYEGMGGQVQMVYMDPPYGIKFGSNFQPYVRKPDVKDNDDKHITREPEMVQAYRDTWELGIHSWLTYMRDRLLLMRELLTDSGSCFVQISDEHVHYVRNIMDEIFGKENFVANICFRTKKMPLDKLLMDTISNSILWYAKDIKRIKFIPIFERKKAEDGFYTFIEDDDGNVKKINETDNLENKKVLLPLNMNSSGLTESCVFDVAFNGKIYKPRAHHSWMTNKKGMESLIKKGRVFATGNVLYYKLYHSDYPVKKMTNLWSDTMGAFGKNYVVQTSNKVIQRCMLMTTEPGDLVFDPTCGSGTTAYVAEQWGRRWITTDVSRVPLSLARQRLLTAVYPYYQLKGDSPSQGFVYQRKLNKKGEQVGGIVPHVTLKSIANDELPQEEVLVDKPEIDNKVARIAGPFCVEAVLPPALSPANDSDSAEDETLMVAENESHYLPRMVKILQHSPVIRLPDNKTLTLADVRPPAKSFNIHAEATSNGGDNSENIAVVFGPANAAISESAIIEAAKEAQAKKHDRLLVVAFVIDPTARKTIENLHQMYIPGLYVQASSDLTMSDLLKTMRTSEVFSVSGLPDITLQKGGKEKNEQTYTLKLNGLDIFDPIESKTIQKTGTDVPCWMLDTDYDGQCFRAGQVFFPRTSAWDNIKKAINTEFSETVWDRLDSDTSEPFIMGENRRVAVKVIDDRGNELIAIKQESEAE